jgi:copper chaperone NosL
MAISEKQYAAEFVDAEGNLLKFDDIGCMLHFVRNHNLKGKGVAYFVVDFEKRNWLEGEPTYYVKSEAIRSPMSGGLVAFRDRAKAQEYAAKLGGQVLNFDDLHP